MKTMCKCSQLDCQRYGCLRERGPIEEPKQEPFAGRPEHRQGFAGVPYERQAA